MLAGWVSGLTLDGVLWSMDWVFVALDAVLWSVGWVSAINLDGVLWSVGWVSALTLDGVLWNVGWVSALNLYGGSFASSLVLPSASPLLTVRVDSGHGKSAGSWHGLWATSSELWMGVELGEGAQGLPCS